jgi:hypothetical protein
MPRPLEDHGRKIKFGQTSHREIRVQPRVQHYKQTFLMMDVEAMKRFALQDFVDRIKQLQLSGLVFYEDHQKEGAHLDALIRRMYCELFYACSYECVTGTVLERFAEKCQVPRFVLLSAHVRSHPSR